MRLRGLLWLNAISSVLPAALPGSATVEGREELPKSRSAPVQAKRYEIVTKRAVLSTHPPLPGLYLDRAFPRPPPVPTQDVSRKELTFIRALLPIEAGRKLE